jgi:hypothetical protein
MNAPGAPESRHGKLFRLRCSAASQQIDLVEKCLAGEPGFSHDFNGLDKNLEIPSVFLPRATVDTTFVPWLWASVNWGIKRQLFPLSDFELAVWWR